MIIRTTWAAVGMIALATATAGAQQTPRRATTVVPAATDANGVKVEPFTVVLTVRGLDARKFLTVDAKNADVRDLFREMGTKSATPVLVAASATGTVTLSMKDKPLSEAMKAVADAASLPLRVLTVPEASISTLTPEVAGQISDALSALPANAAVTDPATGKTLVVEATTPLPKGDATVYFLQGKYTAAQEMAMRVRQATEQQDAGKPDSAITNAVQAINQMPVQQRMDAMREMNRQMWQGMSDQDRRAMRDSFRNGRRGRNRN